MRDYSRQQISPPDANQCQRSPGALLSDFHPTSGRGSGRPLQGVLLLVSQQFDQSLPSIWPFWPHQPIRTLPSHSTGTPIGSSTGSFCRRWRKRRTEWFRTSSSWSKGIKERRKFVRKCGFHGNGVRLSLGRASLFFVCLFFSVFRHFG